MAKRGLYCKQGRSPQKSHPRPRPPLTAAQQPPPGARVIQLTKGWAAWVDEEDFDALSQWAWQISPGEPHPGPHYATRREGPRSAAKAVRMHRVVMGLGADEFVDHRKHHEDIQVVDNRKQNLRLATQPQNAQNTRKLKKGATGYKGVTKSRRWFQARIRVDGHCKELGCYPTPEEAAKAYDDAARKHYGEFAWTNFDEETS